MANIQYYDVILKPVGCDKISELLQERNENNFKKVEKNFLTSRKQHDIIAKLFETNGNAKNDL